MCAAGNSLMTSILTLKIVLAAATGILGISFYGASEIIRVPFLGIPATPEDYGFSYERVHFQGVRNVELAGWWVPADKPSPVTIMVLHGIGSNAGDMLPSSVCLRNKGTWNLFYYDARGHGASGGRHSSLGPLELADLRRAVQFIKQRWPDATRRLGIYGHSLGGAIAIMGTAGIPDFEGVIAENSFSDVRRTVRRFAWIFYHVPYWPFIPLAFILASLMMRVRIGRFSPEKTIGHIAPRAVFLLHGELDRRMPKSDVRALWDAAREPKELWSIPEAGHGNAWLMAKDEYERRMVGFFRNLFERQPA